MPALVHSSADAHNTRRLARAFTPTVPNHHPFLEPNFPKEDEHLVPADLSPRGKLNWELPKETITNLHIMLKLSNKADELLDEWRNKIPQIDEVISEWSEMKGASPTTVGEMQLQAQAMHNDSCLEAKGEGDLGATYSEEAYVFNMAKNLDSPGRGDVIYLTDGIQDSIGRKGSIPQNLRNIEWLNFDGSHIHVADAVTQARPSRIASNLPEQDLDPERVGIPGIDRAPKNLRTTDWECDELLSPTVYSPTATPDAARSNSPIRRPFDDFWLSHQGLSGHQPTSRNAERGLDTQPISPLNNDHCEWRPLNLRT